MNNLKEYLPHAPFKFTKWFLLVLLVMFIVAEIIRFPFRIKEEQTASQVAKIHATKLTLDDVMGKNLPPDPGAQADNTVAGVDANQNGIRDDVELAIFKEYPNSAKTRAVLLQYALFLQTEAMQSINVYTATAASEEYSRAFDCIGMIVPKSNNDIQQIKSYLNFIETKQLNTTERKNIKIKFDQRTGSFELQHGCDVNITNLPN